MSGIAPTTEPSLTARKDRKGYCNHDSITLGEWKAIRVNSGAQLGVKCIIGGKPLCSWQPLLLQTKLFHMISINLYL